MRGRPYLLRVAKISRLRALGRYYRDSSASVFGKLVAFVAVIYAIVPFDLIPDVPIVGWIDDVGVMGMATAWSLRAVARYREPATLAQNSRSPTLEPRISR